MNPIHHAIALARRRLLLQRGLTALGWFICGGFGIAIVLLMAERLLAVPIPWWAYTAVGAGVLGATAMLTWRSPPDDFHVARMIDQRLDLDDRLSSSLYAADLPQDPFARVVVGDAQRAAGRLPVRQAFPVRWSKVWAIVPLMFVALVLLVFLLGPRDILGRRAARAQRVAEQAQVQQLRQQIAQAAGAVQTPKDNAAPRNSQVEKVRQELTELSQADLSTPKARQQAAARVSAAEDALAQAAQQQEQALRRAQDAMSRLEAGRPGPADKMVEALRRGDYASAAKEMENLAKAAPRMSQADKQALQRQMAELAKELEQDAPPSGAQAEPTPARETPLQKTASSAPSTTQPSLAAGPKPPETEPSDQRQNNQSPSQQQPGRQAQAPSSPSNSSEDSQSQSDPVRQLARQLQAMDGHADEHQQSQQQDQQSTSQEAQGKQMAAAQRNGSQAGSQSQGVTSPGGNKQSVPGGQSPSPQSPPSASATSLQEAAHQAAGELARLAQAQRQAQQTRDSQAQLQRALQELAQGPTNNPSGGEDSALPSGSQGNAHGTSDGPLVKGSWGRGSIPDTRDALHDYRDYQVHAESDHPNPLNPPGSSNRAPDDQVTRGAAQVQRVATPSQARQEAERAMAENRVPARYDDVIRQYFDQVSQTPTSPTPTTSP